MRFIFSSFLWWICAAVAIADHLPEAHALSAPATNPYQDQIRQHLSMLTSEDPAERAGAVESLGFLRAYAAESALVTCLRDPAVNVRRQAAMALGWCGGRKTIPHLIDALQDDDWVTRQAAHVSLTNLTGMEFPLHSSGDPNRQSIECRRWRDWWQTVTPTETPPEVLDLLAGPQPWHTQSTVTASSTYKGPPNVLVDGSLGPAYWQTKNVEFPQWVTIDLGKPQPVTEVTIHQYSDAFVMTDFALATSLDGQDFQVVLRQKKRTPATLTVPIPRQTTRYIRITSYGSVNPIYPTTFFEVEVNDGNVARRALSSEQVWRYERGLRAMGILGDARATELICRFLGDRPPSDVLYRPMVDAGIRALGRVRSEAGFAYLVQLLDNPMWARRAADALGDFGDRRAVPALLRAYERYAKRIDGSDPPDVPVDDKMSFPSEDRMLETPYLISFALCRLPLDDEAARRELRRLAPQILANHPGDHDTFMLYEPEPGHLLTRFLLEKSGLLNEAIEHTFEQLGQPRKNEAAEEDLAWPIFAPYRTSSWLPALCRAEDDRPRLLNLLSHEEGWVRLNAAKTLAWLGDARAIEPIAQLLADTPPEAAFGFNSTFKNEEFNDPAPRWREALIRALGILGAHQHTDQLARILDDERSVLEVRHAAAQALGDLGNPAAIAVLQQAARNHPFLSVRHVARDAVRQAGFELAASEDLVRAPPSHPSHHAAPISSSAAESHFDAIIFLKGSNNIPNTLGTVEQADRWRQTYVVTDSGPAYRPAKNIFRLQPPQPDGKVTAITNFSDGYVAEPELSWDAQHILFCRREQESPWWHLWRVDVDGSNLKQLTSGPFHYVGPTYLPDGRILCASSQLGIRDEYHGYPCTGLVTMNDDGTNIQPIATNIGRDNEPALLLDGRIVFSRLEVFYSRNKTELTLHAAHPDGTQDVVLYGPERREFWRNLDHGPITPADVQEAPLTHRVLRMTQPQPMPDGRHIVVATQGGLTFIGPRRDSEEIISPDNKTRAYTTPFPLPDGRLLCASTWKHTEREDVDLGIYILNPASKQLDLVYNDPAMADFEARPIMPRARPPQLASVMTTDSYSARFVCSSAFETQELEVPRRGRYVRLIEGMPVVARHSTHTNPWEVWKNHGGTLARVLGTAPLASDGSFQVEAPADRLLHFQVLDSDRRVLGNQLTWIYARPGEQKSCVGCHEMPHSSARRLDPLAAHMPPVPMLPHPGEFRYRAKAWFKGHLPAEIEERTRTVRAVNLLGR
jgi:HEAT repeat protein